MTSIVKTHLVKIGNSQGIRIPKPVLEQVGLTGQVQVEVEADHLVVRPARLPRQGWEERFQAMAAQGDDKLLDADDLHLTRWEADEWQW